MNEHKQGEANLVTLPNLVLKAALSLKTYTLLTQHFATPPLFNMPPILQTHCVHLLAFPKILPPKCVCHGSHGQVCCPVVHPVTVRVTRLFINESVLDANKSACH